ncbi:MAG: hypothetical protein ACQEVA_07270 [Myxococcota bacterium]
MSTIHMRPRFDLVVDHSADEAMNRLHEYLKQRDSQCRADVYDHQIEIRIREPHHHYWSPELNLLIDRQDESRARLHGKFGPGAHVWTLFMAGYAAFGMVGAAGILIVFSQWSLGGDLWGAWLILAGLVGCALVYLGSRIGQRLAAPQMRDIRELIYDAFPEDVDDAERGAIK